MSVDLDTVTLQGTYRIGFKPPAGGSLAAGELYIEVGAGAPVLWVGAMEDAGFSGGAGVIGTAAAAPAVPPVNRDVPLVWQEGDRLTCTMGNWDGEPTEYAYQWKLDGADVGDGTAAYVFIPEDVGHMATCTVSATNSAGTTEAPPSTEIMIAPATAATAAVPNDIYAPAAAPKPEPKPEPEHEPEPRSKRGR